MSIQFTHQTVAKCVVFTKMFIEIVIYMLDNYIEAKTFTSSKALSQN